MNSIEKIKSLSIWSHELTINPLEGGITNLNFLVKHGNDKLVVRLGQDIPEHLVFRSNEINVSKAAYEIGVSPKLIHSELGVLVLEFIESQTLDPKGVQKNLERIMPVIKKIHHEVPNFLSGQPSIFWVFHVIKYYANFLRSNHSSHQDKIHDLLQKTSTLEKLSSPREIVFGHNDFNQDLEKEALEMYYEKPLTNDVLLKYNSMKTASLLRETMWSMVSEITSKLEFDYGEYTQENLNKFNEAFESL